MLKRYFLELSYEGTRYSGWQRQKNSLTIQEIIEEKISQLIGEKVEITGSGRTDAGVHAKVQFIHFDVAKNLQPIFIRGLNAILPDDIAVNKIFRVNESYSGNVLHARFSPILRGYEYHIGLQHDVFERNFRMPFRVNNSFNFAALFQASMKLMEFEDFASFCKLHGNNNTTLCKIYRSEWMINSEKMVYFIEANRFLRGMVRCVVGTLLDVGLEKITVDDFCNIILKKDRKAAGKNVSPKGLFLSKVIYPEGILIPIV